MRTYRQMILPVANGSRSVDVIAVGKIVERHVFVAPPLAKFAFPQAGMALVQLIECNRDTSPVLILD